VSVEHYYNVIANSVKMDPLKPQLGLSNTSVYVSQGNFYCSFNRENYIPFNEKYFNAVNDVSPYFLIAYGTGSISNHGKNKYVTSYRISLNSSNKSLLFISKLNIIFFVLFVNKLF
jgi:hypothetical protein